MWWNYHFHLASVDSVVEPFLFWLRQHRTGRWSLRHLFSSSRHRTPSRNFENFVEISKKGKSALFHFFWEFQKKVKILKKFNFLKFQGTPPKSRFGGVRMGSETDLGGGPEWPPGSTPGRVEKEEKWLFLPYQRLIKKKDARKEDGQTRPWREKVVFSTLPWTLFPAPLFGQLFATFLNFSGVQKKMKIFKKISKKSEIFYHAETDFSSVPPSQFFLKKIKKNENFVECQNSTNSQNFENFEKIQKIHFFLNSGGYPTFSLFLKILKNFKKKWKNLKKTEFREFCRIPWNSWKVTKRSLSVLETSTPKKNTKEKFDRKSKFCVFLMISTLPRGS